jgi:hypothetical protein
VSNIIFNDTTVQTTGLGFCGSFERTTDQASGGVTLRNLVSFDTRTHAFGVNLNTSNTQVIFSNPGKYFISCLLQFAFTSGGGGSHDITVWYMKNGNVNGSASTCTLNKEANSQVIAVVNDIVTINDLSDFIEFYWWSNITQANVLLKNTAAGTGPVRPASPSAKLNVYKVA